MLKLQTYKTSNPAPTLAHLSCLEPKLSLPLLFFGKLCNSCVVTSSRNFSLIIVSAFFRAEIFAFRSSCSRHQRKTEMSSEYKIANYSYPTHGLNFYRRTFFIHVALNIWILTLFCTLADFQDFCQFTISFNFIKIAGISEFFSWTFTWFLKIT